MDITFLGTGTSQGVPVIACKCGVCASTDPRDKHLRTSALITTDEGKNILIDIGPDFREQMLKAKVMHLDAILITHAHRDHVGGLDDIRAFNYVQQQALDIYGNQLAIETIKRDYHYIFTDHIYPGLPEANPHAIGNDAVFDVGGVMIESIAAMHKDMPILGYRIGPIAYVTDANYIEPREIEKMKGVDILVVNALRKEPHFSHFCLPQALEVIKEVKPAKAYLTHVSHQLGLYSQISKELPQNVYIAYDGLKVSI